jgi:predicted nucleic acid-binding Zn ribbon protein
MPSYDYVCEKCDHEWEETYVIDDRNKPINEKCVNCKKKGGVYKKVAAPFIGDSVRQGVKKPDKGFVEVMQRIKKANRRSDIPY